MKKQMLLVSVLLSSLLTFGFITSNGRAISGANTRVSVSTSGTQANGSSAEDGTTTQDGMYTVFSSTATNLVANDTNAKQDVFMRNNSSGTVIRISVDSSGNQSDGRSYTPRITPNGDYVVFSSEATNLISGDTNGVQDVFLYKRSNGSVELISKSTSGTLGNYPSYYPDINGDGRFLTFISYSTNLDPNATSVVEQVYLRDRAAGTTTLVTQTSGGTAGNSDSIYARISCSGRFIAFVSSSTNLDGSDTNGYRDAFVTDMLLTKSIKNITKSSSGGGVESRISMSCDGNFLAFSSGATNLVGGDTNGKVDAFRYDIQRATLSRVSVDSSGAQTNQNSYHPDLSGDGSLVVFYSDDPASGSGFYASDNNGYYDVFMRDTGASTTSIVSINSSAVIGDKNSYEATINAKGTKITFYSNSTNLVTSDTNNTYDTFVANTDTSNTCSY